MANKPWQEFERLTVADSKAATALCRDWGLVYRDRRGWISYVTENALSPQAYAALKRDHAKFVQAVSGMERYAAALRTGDERKARRLALTVTRTLERDARHFFARTIPVPRVRVEDKLQVLRLKFVPDGRLEDCTTIGMIYYEMLLDFASGPVMRCDNPDCRRLFVGTERQMSLALRKRNPFHVICPDCKASVSEYKLRGDRRRRYMRDLMRKRRAEGKGLAAEASGNRTPPRKVST